MPYQSLPTFKAASDRMFEIPQPAIGGLNLKDLEYEQEPGQSPNMLNVMYRNGSFGKRYGQEIYAGFSDEIYAIAYYDGKIIVHSGTKVYEYSSGATEIASGLPQSKGLFITFAQTLYYLISSGFYQYKNGVWSSVTPYVPDFIINCKPDGSSGGDVIDDLNLLGTQFKLIYNGESGVTVYEVGTYDSDNIIDWSVSPTIEIDGTATTAFTVDAANKTITFTTAPGEGDMNVVMTFTMLSTTFSSELAEILSCKYYDTFGGANNSRLFLAGCANSKYYYSQAYDISYFPENNFATLGNTEEDITGFGRQYNVLIVFKPREVYSIYSYTQTSSTTVIEEDIGTESFKSQLVNAKIGCDCPYTIQLINNLLTWFNSVEGICTLVSTNIQDERNVRIISRNIERTNNFGIKGILDYTESLDGIVSVDYNSRYFLVFPVSGMCFMWDYAISPYSYSSSSETNPKNLDWFLFDNFYVKQFLKIEDDLIYASSNSSFNADLIKLNYSLTDLDFDSDGEGDPISAYYMTPFIQFDAVEYLKNVKNIYVQCRGDANSVVNLSYYTDDSAEPEADAEPISVGGGGSMWSNFSWSGFKWAMNSWAVVFRRKCNLKKIQMAAFLFANEEYKDMAITHIGLQYQVIKNVR